MIEWIAFAYLLWKKHQESTAAAAASAAPDLSPGGERALLRVQRRPNDILPGDDDAIDPMNPWRA